MGNAGDSLVLGRYFVPTSRFSVLKAFNCEVYEPNHVFYCKFFKSSQGHTMLGTVGVSHLKVVAAKKKAVHDGRGSNLIVKSDQIPSKSAG